MFRKISSILVLVLVLSGFFVKPVEARAIPLRVPADVEWVDTGIDVVAGNSLKAKGKAITGPLSEYPGAISGPGGQITICYDDTIDFVDYYCVLEGVPFGALIGKLDGGDPFLIGSDFVFASGGLLSLAVNDFTGTYDDNQAGFTVIFK